MIQPEPEDLPKDNPKLEIAVLRYALTSNPTIYDSLVKQFWQTATTNTKADGTLEINATIDTIGYTITEASIRDTLQLADATGITMLPNDEIFEGMGQMGYPTDGTFTFWKSQEHDAVAQSQPSSSTLPVPSTSSPSNSKEEEPEAQGRKSQDDPLDSLVQGLVTPSTTKVNASGEEQVEDIKEVDTGAKEVNTAEGVNTGSIKLSTVSEQVSTGSEQVSTVSAKRSTPSPDKGQRAGKAPMIIEETPKKSKEQILQEEASLAEAIRLDTLQKEEKSSRFNLEGSCYYTDEDWDLIRAKIEANAELSKSMLGSDLQGEDFAKKMVDLGTWKLSQLKNLSFEEVKEEFDKLVKQVESFAPINFEATKASLKRFGEELQTKTTKRLKDDKAKDAEPAKKSGKRRKHMARKGLHTDIDKDDSEAMKSPSIATYKIIKQGEKGVYQIVREDGTDIVYINFGAMLKDISRDDLTEL
ncbi:hypothetical protein Tco_1577251 [Tanacetum coccineum]